MGRFVGGPLDGLELDKEQFNLVQSGVLSQPGQAPTALFPGKDDCVANSRPILGEPLSRHTNCTMGRAARQYGHFKAMSKAIGNLANGR